jgi:hypothetical protein
MIHETEKPDGAVTHSFAAYSKMMDELRETVAGLAEEYGDEAVSIAADNVLGRDFLRSVLDTLDEDDAESPTFEIRDGKPLTVMLVSVARSKS